MPLAGWSEEGGDRISTYRRNELSRDFSIFKHRLPSRHCSRGGGMIEVAIKESHAVVVMTQLSWA